MVRSRFTKPTGGRPIRIEPGAWWRWVAVWSKRGRWGTWPEWRLNAAPKARVLRPDVHTARPSRAKWAATRYSSGAKWSKTTRGSSVKWIEV